MSDLKEDLGVDGAIKEKTGENQVGCAVGTDQESCLQLCRFEIPTWHPSRDTD